MNGKAVERFLTHSDVGLPKKVCIAHFPARTRRLPRRSLGLRQIHARMFLLYRYGKNEKRPAVHAGLRAVNKVTFTTSRQARFYGTSAIAMMVPHPSTRSPIEFRLPVLDT